MNVELIDNIMVTLRQDRPCKEGLKRILPQRVENGGIYSALGVYITSAPDGMEDVEFFPAEEVEVARVTDALLNRLFQPIQEKLLYDHKKEESEPEPEESLDDQIRSLIMRNELKKAKKMLKTHKEELGKAAKALKKMLKERKSDG